MNDLNLNRSSGYDRLDPKILKVGATELAPSLSMIFNQAIRNREWIAKLKHGEWIPPVQVSKFMDARLSDAITAYGTKNGCETSLIRLTETCRAQLDSKKIVGVLSSDLSEAFDSVSPKLLINKMQAYKFSDIFSDIFSGKRE